MVTKSDFIQWIHHPFSLEESSVAELENLLKKYPYSSNLSFLLAKSYHTQENVLFESQLKHTAISVPDREKLYAFIHSEQKKDITEEVSSTHAETEQKVKSSAADESETLEKPIHNIEKLVSEKKESKKGSEHTQLDQLILSSAMSSISLLEEDEEETISEFPAESQEQIPKVSVKEENVTEPSPASFYDWLAPNEKITEPDQTSETKAKPSIEQLVDKFILERKTETNHIKLDKNNPKKVFYSPVKVAGESLLEKDNFATETLARIYLNQGLSDKAIRIYERLSLKNPEKRAYFADLIEKIRENEHN